MDDQGRAYFSRLCAEADAVPWRERRLIERAQETALAFLLDHALAQTAHYAESLAPFARAGEVDIARLGEMPLVTRAMMQEAPERFYAADMPPAAGAWHEGFTSGSTGRVFKHRRCAAQNNYGAAQTAMVFKAHGLKGGETFARIQHYHQPDQRGPDGKVAQSNWLMNEPTGTYGMLDIRQPDTAQAKWLAALQPHHLMTYPSNAARLATHAEATGWASQLKTVLCTGEQLTGQQRAAITEQTGAKVVNIYGATEIGQIAFECPEAGNLHLFEDSLLVEILRDDGTPAEPGETGAVVITSLLNYAMPMVRYVTGDYASWSTEACPCGRTMRSVSAVLGRQRNLAMYPDGGRFFPTFDPPSFANHADIRQFRIIQKDRTHFHFIYVSTVPDSANNLAALALHLRAKVFPEAEFSFERVDQIDYGPSGKREDFICEAQ